MICLDSKKLRALLTAEETGSLTLAAKALNYTQSGMTHMMNALEKELGITLLHRGRNGVRLTDAARQLLPQIRAAAEAAEALERSVAQLTTQEHPQLRIGTYTSMAQHWLPEIVRRFLQEFPETDISLRMESLTDLYALLRDGELDCVFVSHHPEFLPEDAEWLPLHNDELMAILPMDYSVRGVLFRVQDFDSKDFLMPSSGFELDILPIFSAAGVVPAVQRSNLDDAAILSMVEHGLGLSILSELVMLGRQENVQALPLTPPAYRELGIAFRTDDPGQLMEPFISFARSCVMEMHKV